MELNQGPKKIRFCPTCGAKTDEGANFCRMCGYDLRSVKLSVEPEYHVDNETMSVPSVAHVASGPDTFTWEKFYPDHCTDATIEEMQAEGIRLIADATTNDSDVAFAIEEIQNPEYRKIVIDQLHQSGYPISEKLIVELFQAEGDESLVLRALTYLIGKISSETVFMFADWGMGPELSAYVFDRCDCRFTWKQLSTIFDYTQPTVPQQQKMLKEVIGTPTYDELENILNIVDQSVYPLVKPYVAKLPFQQRIELRDQFWF